jgi:hypothetical protein
MMNMISPIIPYQAGGFNAPGTSPQNGGANFNPANNAFAAVGQNPTMNGTVPPNQFNNTATNALQMYANMGFDKNTQALLGVANNFLDPSKVSSSLGLQAPTVGIGANGYASVVSMPSMVMDIALKQAAIAVVNDQKGFISLMGSVAKDPMAFQNPQFMQLYPQYQAIMGTALGQQAGMPPAQATQFAQLQQQSDLQGKQLQAIISVLSDPTALEGQTATDLFKKIQVALGALVPPAPTATPATSPATPTPAAASAYQQNLLRTIAPKAASPKAT